MSRMLDRLYTDDAGQDLVEYALLSSLLAVLGVTALRFLGVRVFKIWFLAARELS